MRPGMMLALGLALGLAAVAAHAAERKPPPPPPPFFISPMGEPFRAAPGTDPVDIWFAGADRNHDGRLDETEMVADAERFFALLDRDGNGRIEPAEVQAHEEGATAAAAAARKGHGGAASLGGSRALARYDFLSNPQPVTSADTDMNRSITVDEFRAAARRRVRLLDTSGDGVILRAELPLRAPEPEPRGDGRRRPPPPAAATP